MQMFRTMQRPHFAIPQRTLHLSNAVAFFNLSQRCFNLFVHGRSSGSNYAYTKASHMSCNLHKGSLYHTVP